MPSPFGDVGEATVSTAGVCVIMPMIMDERCTHLMNSFVAAISAMMLVQRFLFSFCAKFHALTCWRFA